MCVCVCVYVCVCARLLSLDFRTRRNVQRHLHWPTFPGTTHSRNVSHPMVWARGDGVAKILE